MNVVDGSQELRVALYSHDSVGLGHTRRNLAIAQALADILPNLTDRRLSGLLITGERTATSYRCPEGFDWLVVPGIRKATGRYEPRTLAVGASRLFDIRSTVISGALGTFRPHIVIVDRHPCGVDGELAAPLQALKESKPEVSLVLGLREVLDDPAVAQAEWDQVGVGGVSELYDRIWVYGDRRVHDPLASGELPAELAGLVDFTGLLASGRTSSGRAPRSSRPFVLTMVGGGADGGALARAAAAAPVPAGMQHLVVTGPQMTAAVRAEVNAAAGPATLVASRVPDGLSYVAAAEAVVSMGGYNTIAETLSTDTPALVVPRDRPRTEQLIRARALADVGALDWFNPGRATSEVIGSWLQAATTSDAVRERQQAARRCLDLGGLRRVAALVAELSRRTDRLSYGGPRPPTVPPLVGARTGSTARVPMSGAINAAG